MRFSGVILIALVTSGCVMHIPVKEMPSDSEIIDLSKSQINCAANEVSIIHRGNNPLTDSRNWVLSCPNTKYECELEDDGTASCEEA